MTTENYKLIIVDDEEPARERLEHLLGEIPNWEVIAGCGNGAEALELVQALKPAALLLDIRMPGMGGIETARHIATLESPPAVVFTTAYDEYAMEAFDAQAVGYLLKPVRLERLRMALEQAVRLSASQLRQVAKATSENRSRRHIAARLGDQVRLISLRDVLMFRADRKYVSVVQASGEDLIDESLKDLEEEFESTAAFWSTRRTSSLSTRRPATNTWSDCAAVTKRCQSAAGNSQTSSVTCAWANARPWIESGSVW
jgi:two-component system response regulator AlgR